MRHDKSVTPCVIDVNPTVGHNLQIVNFIGHAIKMSREDPQLRIRLPVELKDKIENTAKENGRSMNSEIVHRLEDSFKDKSLNNSIASLSMALDSFKKVEGAMAQALEAKDNHLRSITDLTHVQADYIAALKEILKTKFNFDVDLFESFDDFVNKNSNKKPT